MASTITWVCKRPNIGSIRWMRLSGRLYRRRRTRSIPPRRRGHRWECFIGASPSGTSQAYGNPGATAGSTQLLSNLVTVKRGYTPVIVNHYNVQPVLTYTRTARRDLGGVGSAV